MLREGREGGREGRREGGKGRKEGGRGGKEGGRQGKEGGAGFFRYKTKMEQLSILGGSVLCSDWLQLIACSKLP